MSGLTLTQWLRALDDDALADLLRARPDLGTPPPADTAVLAARAATQASVARVADGLNTVELAVLDALVLSDADRVPVDVDEAAATYRLPTRLMRASAARLVELALAWGEPSALSLVPAAREIAGPFPAGLGRPVDALSGVDVPAAIAALDEAEHRLLSALAHGQPIGRTRDAAAEVSADSARTPVQRLLAAGLLVRRDAETVELPRQVGLALRGAAPLGAGALHEPTLRTTRHSRSTVDSTAAGEALELLRRMTALLTLWSDEPPPVLKSGGLGVRDLRRLARELDVDERQATLFAELAVAALLVVATDSLTPQWALTTQADLWLASSAANQWVTLAAAWLELPRLPGLTGLRDARDKPIAPLSAELHRHVAPTERARVLDALAELPTGTGIADPDELAAVLAWQAPRRGGRLRDDIVRWTLSEATALGVIALGALTTAASALREDGPAAAAKRIAEAMPQPVDHVLVQADLTVVAPGRLEPDLAEAMAEVADVESAGSATVYRIGEPSLRRALDAGRTATELHELFRVRSRTPIPQSLTYLIDDVARRHGRLRGGVAGCFLRCDDPALVAEVAASNAAAAVELRVIAPTVLVSPLPLIEVLDELRAAGFAPAAEGPDGQVVDLRPARRRAGVPARAVRRTGAVAPPTAEQLTDLVARLRAGDRASASRPTSGVVAGAVSPSGTTLTLLQDAARARSQVWIGYVDANGTAAQRVLIPARAGGGVLEGTDPASGELRRIPLHRITSAALVPG